jgi:succinate dehydrogenase / fumarate reductase cytochrome b subunit
MLRLLRSEFADDADIAVARLAALRHLRSSVTYRSRADRNRRSESMAEAKTSHLKDRPLSPHLQIYKPMLTMMMSIVHRATGIALYAGMLLVVWWLIAAAAGPNPYATVQWFMETVFGRLILFGYTWALIHHMLGGVRHLIWDLGYGFGPVEREWLTAATLVGSVGFTIVLWLVAYLITGGIK